MYGIELEFHGLGRRDVVGVVDGGEITGDAGGIVLREVERRTHILGRLAGCFEDHRRAERVEHPVERLVKQRVLGICLGYEDSTTTTSCAATGCWRCCASAGKSTARGGGRRRTGASRWRGRAR